MSDSDIIATPQHESDPTYDRVHDKEDHLRRLRPRSDGRGCRR